MDYEVDNILADLKKELLDYGKVTIEREEISGTDLEIDFYSDELYIFRSTSDDLVYLYDEVDNSESSLSVSNLKIILERVALRLHSQSKRVYEIEQFLRDL